MNETIKRVKITFSKIFESDTGIDRFNGEFERYYNGVDLYGLNAFLKVRFPDGSIDKFVLYKELDGNVVTVWRTIDEPLTRRSGRLSAQIVLENELGSVIVNSAKFKIEVNESIADETNSYTIIPSAVTELQRELQAEINELERDITIVEGGIEAFELFLNVENATVVDGIITDEFTREKLYKNQDIMIEGVVYKCGAAWDRGWSYGALINNTLKFLLIDDIYYIETEFSIDIEDLESRVTIAENKIPSSASSSNKLVDNAAMRAFSMPLTTKYGAGLSLTIDPSTFVISARLKDQNGNNLGSAQTINLPLETTVVGGSYDNINKKIILTLQNGSTIEFSIADLILGLQREITAQRKLSSDLVDDTNATNKFVSAAEKSTWNGKQNALSSAQLNAVNSGIDSEKVEQIEINADDILLLKGIDYGASLSLTINDSTYVVTAQLKDQNGDNLGAAQTIDLPLESVVVGGSYDDVAKKVVLTLQSGSTVEFSVADLVAGLQNEITAQNKLPSDLVDDTNATNKFVTAAEKEEWNGKVDPEDLEESYAKKDGYYETLRAGSSDTADNLTPFSSDSGEAQDIPFILQGTACGNGETQVDTGSFAQIKEKRGNSVVANQLARELSDTYWASSSSSLTFYNGVASMTASVRGGGVYNRSSYRPDLISGHKYLLSVKIKLATETSNIKITCNVGLAYTSPTTKEQLISTIFVSDTSDERSGMITVQDNRTSDWDEVQIKDFQLIDLTKMFGSNDNIPAHLLSHPEDFIRYYQGSLATNAGTLVNANGRYLECIGRNQWDEEWELGSIDANGQLVPSNSQIRSKNFCKAIPNTSYYCLNVATINWYDSNFNFISRGQTGIDKVATSPANAIYFKIRQDDVHSYNNDITISIYYDGESGYDKYYPYEVLNEVDTGSEILRSAGAAYDIKLPSGEIIRNVGSRAYASGDESDSDVITDGTTTYYALQTPATEQGTPFGENITIDDFGSMQWSNTAFNGIPQGCEIFYPVDYKAFVDSLYNHADGNANGFMLKSENVIPPAPTEDGTFALKVIIIDGNATYQWVDEQ